MGRRDVKSQVEMTVLHTKIQHTTTQTIQGTDVASFHGASFLIDVGDWTADDLTVTFQHRDGSDSWADIPNSELEGEDNDRAIVTGDADTQIYVGYTGNKEDIGAVITDGGTGDAVLGVYVIKGYPSRFPVN